MPRYLVQRTFPTGLAIPINDDGAAAIDQVNTVNAESGVTWSHSYVSEDRRTTYCVYDGPSPDAIRHAAACNGLPVDTITLVDELSAHPYR